MHRTLATLVAALLTTAAASAQSYPDANSGGHELGIQQVNSSGQVGTVTLFDHGAQSLVVVNVKGTGARTQSVRLYRGHDCETDIESTPAAFLNDLKGGSSVSTVKMPYSRLVSGNYNLLIFSSTQKGARAVSCGHLYSS